LVEELGFIAHLECGYKSHHKPDDLPFPSPPAIPDGTAGEASGQCNVTVM